MLNKKEMADRLSVHEQTVDRWAKHGIIKAHFYNDHGWQLYELGRTSRLNIAVDGSAWSFSWHNRARESIPFLPSTASVATRMRIWGVI
jgi:hypothetical protein